MHVIDFIQKIFLLLLGGYITTMVSHQIMQPDVSIDHEKMSDIQKYTGHAFFNPYELSLMEDVFLPTDIRVRMKDIYGLKEEKIMIIRSLFGSKNKIFKNVTNTKGILLYGPPGTGKTMLAQAIAKDANMPLICFNVANIENKLLGESNKYINALFTLSQKIAPCILFIDEIDCVCGSRNAFDQSHVNSMKSVMLTHMDGLASANPRTIFIGATNRIDAIDPAFKRRVPIHIPIPIPDFDTIRHLVRSLLDADDTTIRDISMICLGMSCSDVRQLCHLVSTTYDGSESVTQCFFKHAHHLNA